MSSPPPAQTPADSPARGDVFATSLVTPETALRSRSLKSMPGYFHFSGESNTASSNASPTSTLDSTPQSNVQGTPRSLAEALANRSQLRNTFSSQSDSPVFRTVIRPDSSLVTCFDPSDKELYDLWAPKK